MRNQARQKILVSVMIGVLALASRSAGAAETPFEERSHLETATAASFAQVEVGRLAAAKSQDDEVRAFARDLLAQHEDVYQQLTAEARRFGVEPVASLDPVTRRWLDRLEPAGGREFDALYVSGQRSSLHLVEVAFERQARIGEDERLRALARRQADAAAGHIETATRLAEDLAADLPPGPHPEDWTFLVFAMEVDRLQVQLADLALEKATDEEVRQFARLMRDDHGRTTEAVRQVADKHDVAAPDSLSPVAERVHDRLTRLSGWKFDQSYLMSQVYDHALWFYRFEQAAIHGHDPSVRALAAEGTRLGDLHHRAVATLARRWESGETDAVPAEASHH